ncbi:hypothetical protein T03_15806 [Trichinella britovi]|uniref:Uncharacterized protein n=1 Tax=Trichinella britovi TaxID=45882 RepID=A0A0V0Z1T9_TRIBR|nr:hypothetical protein T03_15806 [Trichinella britovi]
MTIRIFSSKQTTQAAQPLQVSEISVPLGKRV